MMRLLVLLAALASCGPPPLPPAADPDAGIKIPHLIRVSDDEDLGQIIGDRETWYAHALGVVAWAGEYGRAYHEAADCTGPRYVASNTVSLSSRPIMPWKMIATPKGGVLQIASKSYTDSSNLCVVEAGPIEGIEVVDTYPGDRLPDPLQTRVELR